MEKVVAGVRVFWTGDGERAGKVEFTGGIGRCVGVGNGVGSAAVGLCWVPIP